jgi:ribokinase
VALTEGEQGGSYTLRAGGSGRWAPLSPPGPLVDSYGCGDAFVAGLTYGLASRMELAAALALGARCGAVCATGHGPYERQLDAAALAAAS